MRRTWPAAVAATTLVLTICSAPAAPAAPTAAAPPLSTPGDVSRIVRVESVTAGGWTYDTYRNPAYPCSISGYQTFTVGTRAGSSPTQAAPLWTYLHGGGTGYFDSTGVPRPDDSHMREETPQEQRADLVEKALTSRITAASATNRLLAVSMCNRDIYGGVGLPDPNNPFTTPDGRTRTTNGLLHTKAAVQFTTARYRTNDNFVYGTSAGSAGTFHVAYGLQLQGLAPAGLIADSGIVNTLHAGQEPDPGCGRPAEWFDVFPRRLHPAITNGSNDPDLLVSRGELTVPILQVWSKDDAGDCGVRVEPCPLRDGSAPVMGSVDCAHEPLRLAIAAQGPASRSDSMRLCVSPPGEHDTCTQHVPTTKPWAVNTLEGVPADFNAAIMAWVQQRTRDDAD